MHKNSIINKIHQYSIYYIKKLPHISNSAMPKNLKKIIKEQNHPNQSITIWIHNNNNNYYYYNYYYYYYYYYTHTRLTALCPGLPR